jgi:hypothetical protein
MGSRYPLSDVSIVVSCSRNSGSRNLVETTLAATAKGRGAGCSYTTLYDGNGVRDTESIHLLINVV